MKILITGGCGFIGSHLCEKYVEKHTVICYDNFLNGDLSNVKHLLDYRNFKLIKGDIRDSDLLDKTMHDVEVVMHLAAQIHVDRSYVEPFSTYDINVMGTQKVLESARLHDVRKVLFASSSEVYGSAVEVPMSESHPLNAPHPYGASKTAADRLCYAYQKTFGMNIAIMRCFNIFGQRQKDIGYGGVISIFARRILNNMPPIIYGDGNQTRDYLYIDDIVNAYDLVLNSDHIEEPINFGTGYEISIKDLAHKILNILGGNRAFAPVHEKARMGEVDRLICDNSLAKGLLNWQPKVTLDAGLSDYLEWYQNYGREERIKIE